MVSSIISRRALALYLNICFQNHSHYPEASEPIDTNISRPDTFADRANDSASQAREKIATQFEPGMLFSFRLCVLAGYC